MKLLFITRTYPPLIGGMETFAYDFYENYHKKGNIDLLENSKSNKMLAFFFIKAFFYIILYSRKYDVIHIYDAVLAPLALIIKTFSKAKVSFTVNGLDIVYSHFGYQIYMPFFLNKADRIFAISQSTKEHCVRRGIPNEKLVVIPIGLDFDKVVALSEEEKTTIISRLNLPKKGKKILLSVGRLVKRKGHAWFIENVFIRLPNHYIYVIAGIGPEKEMILEITNQLNLTKRVFLLGRVSDEEKTCLYQIADFFIMPNIHIKDDHEGFGIVLIEAGKYGLPVIASNIEGIRDVVINNKTGRLIDEKNTQGYLDAILEFSPDRFSISPILDSYFNWDNIITRYSNEFEKMLI